MSNAEKLTAKKVKDGEAPLRPSLARRLRAHDAEVAKDDAEKVRTVKSNSDD